MKNKINQGNKKKTGSFFREVIALLIILLITVSSITLAYVAASPVLTITKSVDNPNPYTGESFYYTLKYALPSTTEDATDVILEDILPSNVEFVSYIASSDVASVSVTNNGTNDVVRFIFNPVLSAGSTGLVKIEARFPAGTTLPNSAVNAATIDPSNGDLVTSNPVTVTPKFIAASDWSIAKTRIIPASVLPAVGNNVTYQVTVNSNSEIGGMDLKDIVIVDTIPAGSTFVSASNGGTYNSGTGKVTWNIASLPVGTSQNLTVVVNYPSPTFTLASSVTNAVLGTATQYDNTAAPNKNASVTHGFAAPTYSLAAFSKGNRQSNDRYSVGQTARFTLTNIGNSGNSPLDRLEITDNVPAEITLTQISTGTYNSSTSVQIQYKTNLNATFRTWTGSPFASPANTTLNVSALGLTSGEYVTQVKWTITDTASGKIQPGFANTAALSVNGIVSAPVSGTSITNTATLQAFYGANVITLNASNTIYIAAQMPWLVPIKTVNGGQTRFNYNDTVTFNLRIQNHDYATGNYVNPIAVDTIPPEYENITYVGWDAGNSSISTAPVIDATGTKVISGITYTLLKADFTGTLLPGQYVNVQYSAKIKDLTDTGLITNSLYISTLDNSTVYQNATSDIITDSNDLDGDGSTTDRFVKADATIFVNFQGSLEARKQIKGADDADFTYIRYPNYTYTYPGDYVNYRLVVKNTGSNGPITNVVLIDKLPTIGDTGVVDSSARNTQWTPYLVNVITGANGAALPAGVTVYYSTVVNPTCAELTTPQNHTNNPADLWSSTPPADITTVKSIKIDFGSLVMNTNDEFTLEWPMRAPVGAPLGQIAWNSFGYSATYPDLAANGTTVVQSAFLPSEPIKVGFEIKTPPPFAVGNFVWEDLNKNGIQDAGEPGINNVLVNIYQKVGSDYVLYDYTRTGNDQTGNAGYYTFPQVPLGTYRMEFVYPKTYTNTSGYTSTYAVSPYLTGTDRTIDSNGNPATITDYTDLGVVKNSILTPDFTISTADDMSIDLGLYRLSSIGDKVWYDYNADGLQAGTSAEPGLAGVTVTLLDSAGAQALYGNGTPVPAQTTDASGNYLFTGLDPGVYKIRFNMPTGYKLSTADVGANDAIDSDAIMDVGTTATTGNYTLLSGTQNLTVDMGVYLGHIGNLVFNDLNADGLKNGSDAGISGVTVRLYKDGNTTAYKTTTTNSSGIYSFDDLPPGTYVVEVVRPSTYNTNGKFTVSSGTTPGVDNDSDVNITVNSSTNKTSDIVLTAGERIDTIDAGMYRFGSIGNFVWNDRNANGTQDSGEPAISGVTVRLTDATGNPVTNGLGVVVADTITNASGNYSFGSLNPGTYRVVFVNPGQNYNFSPSNGAVTVATNSDGIWTNANDPTATTGIITITSNLNVTYVDQGMYLGALGDFVWDDYNANGRQDAGEPGINGVTVSLIDASTGLQARNVNGVLIPATTTNSSGAYRFDDLAAGSYIVQFSMPTGWDKATPRYASVATTATDSNADTTTFRSDTIVLAAAQRDFTIDAGFYKYAKLGDLIWRDLDADGIQDPGEVGIAGATVNLLDGAGNTIATTTTDASGIYTFSNLIPGTYAIQAVMPAGFDGASPATQGSNTAIDSNLNTTTLKSANVTLISGQNNTTFDGGFYQFASIGDYIWEDVNGNGIQDAGEPPVSGVTVRLLNSAGTQIGSTVTDASGFYTFTSLVPGGYTIEIVKPAAYDGITLKGQGGNNTTDSDINPITWRSDLTTLISGENNMYVDAGLYKFASLGDYVWSDINANGIQNSGEVGIPNVTVRLLNSGGTQVATTTTNASGAYSFTGLAPGSYIVEVVKPGGYLNSPKTAGSDTAIDSNINIANSRSDVIALISGENNPTIDAGLYRVASLGDLVWNDLNANGIQDAGEPGISGATVNLLNNLGVQVATTTTNASGIYSFTGLTPGTYTAEVVKPAGFDILTDKTVGSNTAIDSNLNPDFKSDPVTLVSNENNITIDAGFYKLASLGDYIWEDLNANGIQDTGEPGIPGATVKLLNNLGVQIATTTTDSSGLYSFTGLIPGTYTVEVVTPAGFVKLTAKAAGSNTAKDSNLNPDLKSDPVTLISGENNLTIDGGFYNLASLGDYVWNDLNENGIQDAGEPGMEGVEINLLNNAGVQISTTTSDSNGAYSFENLVPGTYTVAVVRPSGYIFSPQTAGSNTAIDSNIDPITYLSNTVVLISGENNMTIDAGVRVARPLIDIQKYVSFDNGATWHDADTVPGPQYYPQTGIDPSFKFVVTNTGNVTLTDISVDDDIFGNIDTITSIAPAEVWEKEIITEYYFSDLDTTGPVDWISNQNVSLNQTGSPKLWDFRAFPDNLHQEGTWITGDNFWTTGYWYYLGVIQPGETAHLPISVMLDEDLTTNEYMGATFYLQPKFEAIQTKNEAVYDEWGMGYLPAISKWLPTAYDNTDQRWEATDTDVLPAVSYFWDMLEKLWHLIV